jgi:hypothetical protein
MGNDIGRWNKETKQYEFDPVDVDRLQIMADATGVSLESMTKMIQKKAEDARKVQFMPDLTYKGIVGPDGKPMDPASIKDMIGESIDIEGNIKEGSLLDEAGVKSLAELTDDQLKGIMTDKAAKEKMLEEQAKENQSLMGSLTSLKDAFFNIFTIIQPAIEVLTTVLQWFGALLRNDVAKWIIGLTVALMLLAKTKAIGRIADGLAGAKTLVSSLSGVFANGIKGIGESISGAFAKGATKAVVEKGAGAAIETGGKVAGGAASGGIMASLAAGLTAFSAVPWQGILKFAAFIAILGGTLGGLALIFKGVDPLLLLAFGGAIVELAGALFIASLAAKGIQMKDMITLSLAMLIIGAAMIPFAAALVIMEGVSWGTMAKAGVAILGIIGILIGLGAIMMTGVGAALIGLGMVALLGVALTMAAVGAAFIVFASGMNSLATIDWSGFGKMGAGLMGLIGPLMAVAIAGLVVLNPITMLGMLMMVGVLGLMAVVLAPLGESLAIGASSLNTMATSVQKLNESLGKLDFEKLERLKEISAGFAQASMGGGALATAMEKLAAAIGGGKGGAGGTGGGGTKTLIVQLKMPNGRIVQEQIIHDIDKVS